jgi:hypothetical protein
VVAAPSAWPAPRRRRMLRRQAVAVAVARPYVRKVQGRRVRRWLKMQGAAGLDAMQPQTMQGVAGGGGAVGGPGADSGADASDLVSTAARRSAGVWVPLSSAVGCGLLGWRSLPSISRRFSKAPAELGENCAGFSTSYAACVSAMTALGGGSGWLPLRSLAGRAGARGSSGASSCCGSAGVGSVRPSAMSRICAPVLESKMEKTAGAVDSSPAASSGTTSVISGSRPGWSSVARSCGEMPAGAMGEDSVC